MYGLDKFFFKVVNEGGKVLAPIIIGAVIDLITDNFNI